MKYFSYDPEGDGFELHNTAEEARRAANVGIDCAREWSCEGWDDSVEHICWGEVKERSTKVNEMTKEEAEHAGIYVTNDFDFICDYQLKEIV